MKLIETLLGNTKPALKLGKWVITPGKPKGYDIYHLNDPDDSLAWAPDTESAKDVVAEICRRNGRRAPKGDWVPSEAHVATTPTYE